MASNPRGAPSPRPAAPCDRPGRRPSCPPPNPPPTTTFARRHGWLVVLVVGAALFIAEERTLVATRNPNLVPSAILLGASIVPLAFLAFVYGRRLPYGVPGRPSRPRRSSAA